MFRFFSFFVGSFFLFFSIAEGIDRRKNNPEYQHMFALGEECNTAKITWHDYGLVYAKYLSHLRNKPIKFLEIGILHGDSVKMWERYFPKGDLHFVDKTFERITYFSKRSSYYLADQKIPEELRKVIKETGSGFDVIMDDAGHHSEGQITSFIELFPHLKSGGLYIIEDLHTSYWKRYGGHGNHKNPVAGSGSIIEFLQNLIHDVNFVGANTGRSNFPLLSENYKANLSYYQKHIYSIHFYDSVCIVIKR